MSKQRPNPSLQRRANGVPPSSNVSEILQTTSRLVAIVLLLYGAACVALFSFQRSLIYFPQPSAFDTPSTTLTLPVPGAELVVSIRPHAGQKALIYFGGNAEDVSSNLSSFSGAFPDYAIYLLHYRGYGGSSGKASEEMLHADAQALFDKVHAQHPNIAVVGRSLGSGVAIRLASQRPVSRLVLVTPFDKGQAKVIEKAIRESELGLDPAHQGGVIRVPLPSMNEQRRKELVKVLSKLAEDGRIAIRHARTDARDKVKKLDGVSEDDKKHAEKELQKAHDDGIGKLDVLLKTKEAEIMEV